MILSHYLHHHFLQNDFDTAKTIFLKHIPRDETFATYEEYNHSALMYCEFGDKKCITKGVFWYIWGVCLRIYNVYICGDLKNVLRMFKDILSKQNYSSLKVSKNNLFPSKKLDWKTK